MHPDPRPSLGIVTIDLDANLESTPLLEGEQNINLPIAESGQHAALSTPTIPSYILHLKSSMSDLPWGEGTATEQRDTKDSPLKF